MKTASNYTLNWPSDLPRWTVPLVLLSTLALELWDVWSERTAAPPFDPWGCATLCDQSGWAAGSPRVVGTYTTTSCTCVAP